MWLKSAPHFNPTVLLLHPSLQSPIKALKASEPGQPECTKRRVRREEQCLSNTEWVDGHICPCRVCEGERERETARGRCSGHTPWDLSRKCFLNYTCLSPCTFFIPQLYENTCWHEVFFDPKNPQRQLSLLYLGIFNRYNVVAKCVNPKGEFITLLTRLTSEELNSQLLHFISDMLHHERKYLHEDGIQRVRWRDVLFTF